MRTYYCYRESWGSKTNLQLWSLLKAWEQYRELQTLHDELGESRLRERCVVILDLLGLSLSQLLGQNTEIDSDRVPSLFGLLDDLRRNLQSPSRAESQLSKYAREFVKDYDSCRHFGKKKHARIDKIDLEKITQYVEFTLWVWQIICSQVDGDPEPIETLLNSLLDGSQDYAPEEEFS